MPEFRVRNSGQDCACAFLKGKAKGVRGTHETSQEIAYVGHPVVVTGIEPKGQGGTARMGCLRLVISGRVFSPGGNLFITHKKIERMEKTYLSG
jgi:hypothetical protein